MKTTVSPLQLKEYVNSLLNCFFINSQSKGGGVTLFHINMALDRCLYCCTLKKTWYPPPTCQKSFFKAR